MGKQRLCFGPLEWSVVVALGAFILGACSSGGSSSGQCARDGSCNAACANNGLVDPDCAQTSTGGSVGVGGGASATGGTTTGSGGSGTGETGVCTVTADSDACDICMYGSCCDELTACADSTDCMAFSNCVMECSTDACIESCIDSYPAGALLLLDAADCMDTYCSASCG